MTRRMNRADGARLLEDEALDGAKVVLAADHRGSCTQGGVRVLEAVAGEYADHAFRAAAFVLALDLEAVGEEAGDRGGRGRLTADALVLGQPTVGLEDLFVGDRGDPAARSGEGGHRLLPAGGVADADRRGNRLGCLDRVAQDQGGGAGGLESVADRRGVQLLEAAPVG